MCRRLLVPVAKRKKKLSSVVNIVATHELTCKAFCQHDSLLCSLANIRKDFVVFIACIKHSIAVKTAIYLI